MRPFPTSSSLGKPGGTQEKLLKLIRSHPACLVGLRLDVTMRISDEDIMDALAKSADNLDIDFRERMVPEEMIQEIVELRLQARAEVALMSEIRRHNVWIVLIRIPLCMGSILVFASFVLWLTTFEYTRAVCALFEFANATCSQANSCLFRVAVQLPGEQFAVFHPAWTLPAEEAWGTAIFDRSGPFRCCNTPKFYINGVGVETSMAVGAGTPCCDFIDENRSLYCDNFGDPQRQPNPVADCPASPWACGVKTEIVDGETRVKELQVWVDPPSLELFLAALACLSAAGLVRMSPQILRILGRCLEHCNSKFHIFAHTTGRRLRRLRKGGRSSRLSTSSAAESDHGPDPRRSSRKSRPKAAAKAVNDMERRSVQSEESEDVISTEAKVPVRAVWVQPARAGPQMVGEVVGETTVEPSPVVTVAVRAAKVQPDHHGPREAARQEPVRLEEILRPIITPANRLRRDNSRDRDLQAPRPAARPKHRQLPRRIMANAPQPTVSPVKVMQMSQTQEQWMATSAQLRQMTQTQDPPPDLSAQGRNSRRPRGRSGPQAPRQTHV